MSNEREAFAKGFQAGLRALRAQGLEPSEFAKHLADEVCADRVTLEEMTDVLVKHPPGSLRADHE